MQDQSKLLTVRQVADLIGAKPSTIQRWCREKRIHAVLVGGPRLGYRIHQSAVDRLLEREVAEHAN